MNHDNAPADCRTHDNPAPSLPRSSCLPINRCNLPAVILGSLTFQRHPTDLFLDGVAEFHAGLFRRLDLIDDAAARGEAFRDYVTVHFRLERLEDAGLDERNAGDETRSSAKRVNANWMRTLRGWSFDADGREGAVLKGWVESRFGLLPRFHGEALHDLSAPAYRRYLEMRSAGLYGTNALEAQLDLLYAYCQYEFCRGPPRSHLRLYRGVNRLDEHEVLSDAGRRQTVLFNNLVSFSTSRERAEEFGDYILAADVPTAKIFFHYALLPGVLKGEDELLVIGGTYDVEIYTF